jgi:peptidyl-prolyl cis-trans isomerase B (cyclophilin B)
MLLLKKAKTPAKGRKIEDVEQQKERLVASKKKSQNIYASAAASAQKFEQHKAEVAKKASIRKNDNRFALMVSAGAVALALILQLAYFGFGPGKTEPTPEVSANSALVPAASLAEGREWSGTLEVGGKKLELTLDGAAAPQAVSNFLSLANKNFYTDVSCHRLTTAGIFVLQCGDPNGDGTGGPGYSFGPIENAPAEDLYKEGYLAMARRGGDGSSMGSQFFIVYADSTIPSDDAGGYTVFGKITKGLSGLDSAIKAGTEDGSGDGKPAQEIKLGAIALQ